jgi:hypothetical protein
MRLEIYEAIFDYCLNGKEPTLTGISKMFFMLIRPQLDANNTRYENGKKGAEFGKKGGRPKKQTEQSKPLISKGNEQKIINEKPLNNPYGVISENPKETPNVNDNVNDNVNENKDSINPPTPLIQETKQEKNDDDDFMKKSKERFNYSHLEIENVKMQNGIKKEIESYRQEAKRILPLIKEDLFYFIDHTSPAIHSDKDFYELLKMGYTAKEIGHVVSLLSEKLNEKPIKIKTWGYVKISVLNYYKGKIN